LREKNFIISKLENGWNWQDMNNKDDIENYCIEELEIPEEVIKELNYYDNAFELSLVGSSSFSRDDWYVNLQRSA